MQRILQHVSCQLLVTPAAVRAQIAQQLDALFVQQESIFLAALVYLAQQERIGLDPLVLVAQQIVMFAVMRVLARHVLLAMLFQADHVTLAQQIVKSVVVQVFAQHAIQIIICTQAYVMPVVL